MGPGFRACLFGLKDSVEGSFLLIFLEDKKHMLLGLIGLISFAHCWDIHCCVRTSHSAMLLA